MDSGTQDTDTVRDRETDSDNAGESGRLLVSDNKSENAGESGPQIVSDNLSDNAGESGPQNVPDNKGDNAGESGPQNVPDNKGCVFEIRMSDNAGESGPQIVPDNKGCVVEIRMSDNAGESGPQIVSDNKSDNAGESGRLSVSDNKSDNSDEPKVEELSLEKKAIAFESSMGQELKPGEVTYTKTEESEIAVLTTRFTALDSVYIRNAAKKEKQDMLFLDCEGNLDVPEKDSSCSGPVTVDISEECDGNDVNCRTNNYRKTSETSVSDLSSSDSDIEIELEEVFRSGPHLHRNEAISQEEVSTRDMPTVEDLSLSVPEEECQKVGRVSYLVGEIVVIKAYPNTPALDFGTVLFMNSGKNAVGEIFEVFGPVKEPYYTVRFNSEEHARSHGIVEGLEILCAPRTEFTNFVFVYEMLQMRGSDASWENNREPPMHCLDFSDDEEERVARRKKKVNKGTMAQLGSDTIDDEVQIICGGEVDNGVESLTLEGAKEKSPPSVPVPPSNNGWDLHYNCSTPFEYQNQIFPEHEAPLTSDASLNIPEISVRATALPLHPPGHPPVRTYIAASSRDSEQALKAARQINELEIDRRMYGAYFNADHSPSSKPTATVTSNSEHATQDPRIPLLPTPGPLKQHRPPLLPSPSTHPWAVAVGPRTHLPLDPPNGNPRALPNAELNQGYSWYGTSSTSPGSSFFCPCPEHDSRRPSASSLSSSPFSSFPPSSRTFSVPATFSSPSQMALACPSARRNPFFRPPLTQPDQIHSQMNSRRTRPYVIKPSSRFPRSSGSNGPPSQ